MMELKGSKTEANLIAAFSGESQAAAKYTYYAGKARKEGFAQIAEIFLETARNEREHAEQWFKKLNDGIRSTAENLEDAASGEHYEWTEMYATFEKEAKEEGFDEIANLFRMVGAIENRHENRYLKLLENVQNDQVFKKQESTQWICMNCGYIHEGKEAPKVCPVCKHPQSDFQLYGENF